MMLIERLEVIKKLLEFDLKLEKFQSISSQVSKVVIDTAER